jgi:hypothetical protein
MRFSIFPFIYLLMLVLVALLLAIVATLVHAQSPVISPNGQVTIVYPSQNGMPAMAIAPNGGVTYGYPSGPNPMTAVPLPLMVPSPLMMPMMISPMMGGK